MKTKLLTRINALLVFLLGILGFTSCELMPKKYGVAPVVEYGCPYVSLEVSGQITNEEKQPLRDIQVNLSLEGYRTRPVFTDSLGNFSWRSQDGKLDSLDIIIKDPAGVYEGDSTRVGAEKHIFDQPKGWQIGESTVRQDFQLKKKE